MVWFCRCVNLRSGKSDSVRLRCDALRCGAVWKRVDSRGWAFKWAVAVPCRGVSCRGVPSHPPLWLSVRTIQMRFRMVFCIF